MVSIVTFRHLLAATILSSCFLAGCTDNQPKTESKETMNPASSPIDGEWAMVWVKTGDTINNSAKPMQFKMFHNGFFSWIMQDSTGKWSFAGAGTFEVNGNTYKETIQYCSLPEFVGLINMQEFELKGDTLYNKLFTKVTNAAGQDISAQFPTNIEEKRVRAKR